MFNRTTIRKGPDNIDMALDEGATNTLETYEKAAIQKYEEHDIALPKPSEIGVESFNEQQRFQEGVAEIMEARGQLPESD